MKRRDCIARSCKKPQNAEAQKALHNLRKVSDTKERGAINTPSYQTVTEPINSRARYRWKRYEGELAPVMADLAPFIEAFGYA